jgi:hypothetical protein
MVVYVVVIVQADMIHPPPRAARLDEFDSVTQFIIGNFIYRKETHKWPDI